MGIAKRMWEEEMDRGWSSPDTHVCAKCVNDDYLKAIIQDNLAERSCDYCKARTRNKSAAPLELLMPSVEFGISRHFTEPSQAGVPYETREGGWAVKPTDTLDVLLTLSGAFDEDLLEDVARAFHTTDWVRSSYGHWATPEDSDEWSYDWNEFVESVKYKSRYFFMNANRKGAEQQRSSALNILDEIAAHAHIRHLIKPFEKGQPLFRVREKLAHQSWELCENELQAPPNELAAAGRMNPAGIAYMYLAVQPNVALGEVLSHPPCSAAGASFKTKRELLLLDLTELPEMPSVFDMEGYNLRQSLHFLEEFVADISRPFQKDGREHISYVPSQVVSEYFNQVFVTPEGKSLDGIMYPSSIQPGGKNVVLFPPEGCETSPNLLEYEGAVWLNFDTWPELTNAVSNSDFLFYPGDWHANRHY